MIDEIALAIEMGADAIDIGKTIHSHPTLRCAVKALAAPVQPATAGVSAPVVAAPQANTLPTTPEPVSPKRAPAHYLWAVLIARIYEVFPLLCDKATSIL